MKKDRKRVITRYQINDLCEENKLLIQKIYKKDFEIGGYSFNLSDAMKYKFFPELGHVSWFSTEILFCIDN